MLSSVTTCPRLSLPHTLNQMQGSLQGQSGAASSYITLSPASNSLRSTALPNNFPQDFTPQWNECPTVVDFEQEDYTGSQVPDGAKPYGYEVPSDVENSEPEYCKGGSAPITINNRKRSFNVSNSSCTPDSMETESPSQMGSYMERQRMSNFPPGNSGGGNIPQVISPKQGRHTWLPPNENSSDGFFPMDDRSSSPDYNSPPKNGEGKKGDKAPKEHVNSADRLVITSCMQTDMQLLNDDGLTKMGQLSINWVKQPAKKVRPSYNCEGSRGVIKTEDGSAVELDVTLASDYDEKYAVVVIAACILDKKGQKVTGHPHFRTNCVADQPFMEVDIDGVSAICIKKTISGQQTKLRLDVGIKRSGERAPKLNRKCRVIYRLVLLKRIYAADSSLSWTPAHWAQIVTDPISCEQSQGPPSITNFTSKRCSVDGKLVVAVKGKNLESKADDQSNVVVKFIHKGSKWEAPATVYHNVTTQYSLAFQVPPLGTWRNIVRAKPATTSIPVTIEVSVDDRAAEAIYDFEYVVRRQQQNDIRSRNFSTSDADRFETLPYEDVMTVLHSVEANGGNETRHANDPSMGNVAVGSLQSFQHHTPSYPTNQVTPDAHRAFKMEPDLAPSCMLPQEDLTWGFPNYPEQQFVDQLRIEDKPVVTEANFFTS